MLSAEGQVTGELQAPAVEVKCEKRWDCSHRENCQGSLDVREGEGGGRQARSESLGSGRRGDGAVAKVPHHKREDRSSDPQLPHKSWVWQCAI